MSLIIREIQTKTAMSTTSYLLGCIIIKRWTKSKFGKDVQNLESSCIAGGNENSTAAVEDSLAGHQNIKQ